ncbi:gamma-glutamyl-gamma-aminobutyrate hydrolase family protein [Lacticaseibacillus yichunensis]|uniref:Gamma-glutamyl-gamma-aminobutyrate hydrolase family protein n=1 Tax=Lacticaseibacillus yichunensis TaxID=2486015 RepID=A0ABW4CSE1_9LACO|nr:gamma-glutamyl-gamma-aminobutyrate hydrolase family protein [Lacticaseibacillus yichunensis]
MHPVIAIPADSLTTPSAAINLNQADYSPHMIKNALIACKAVPIVLPFPEVDDAVTPLVDHYIGLFDGLLLPGGPDIDPTLYGEEPIPELGAVIYPEDRFEVALVRKAIAAGKPLFAICRGMQVLNVALGGDLYQDLVTEDPDSRIRHAQAASGQYPTHHIKTMADSRLNMLLGDRVYVNSRHHQAIRRVAPSLKVTAVAEDGVVEGVESRDSHQLVGVQWHPENLWETQPSQLDLFADLVARAIAHAQ